MDSLTYSVKDVVVLETFSQRRPNIQATSTTAMVDYQIPVATVSESTNELYVETQYSIVVHGAEDQPDEEPLATIRTRVGVVLLPSRKIIDSEIADGTLAPSQELVRQLAQSYHRQLILHMSTQLGIPPLQLPAGFEQAAASPAAVNDLEALAGEVNA